MISKSVFCLIGLVAVINADNACPYTDAYIYYPDLQVSYKFFTQALTWAEARELCISENATLAVPKNAAERNAIKKIFAEYPENQIVNPTLSNHLLLGFHDLFEENEFITDSGFSIDYFYRDFEIGQPDSGRGENSLSMERNGKYHDFPHNETAAFICQKDHTTYEKKILDWNSETNFRDDIEYIHEPTSLKRYKLHTDLKTWAMARTICFAEGGHLAIIRNKDEEEFLINLINHRKNKVMYSPLVGNAWVGYHDMFTEGQFISVKGETMEQIGYSEWSSGQPNGNFAENCAVIDTTGQLQDADCNLKIMYICERPNPLSKILEKEGISIYS